MKKRVRRLVFIAGILYAMRCVHVEVQNVN